MESVINEIAQKLVGIAKDDLTKAELSIVNILRRQGILVFQHNTDEEIVQLASLSMPSKSLDERLNQLLFIGVLEEVEIKQLNETKTLLQE